MPTLIPPHLPTLLAADAAVVRLCDQAIAQKRAVARGSSGSSPIFTAAAVARRTGRHVLLMVAHADDADEGLDELTSAKTPAIRFPALEALPGESSISLDLLAERLNVVKTIGEWGDGGGGKVAPTVLIAPVQALMQAVPAAGQLESGLLTLHRNDKRGPGFVIAWLDTAGYKRTTAVEEPGDYAVRGGIIDVFPPGEPTAAESVPGAPAVSTGGVPVRLDYFGNDLDRLTEIDLDTMGVDRAVDAVELVCAKPEMAQSKERGANLLELLPPGTVVILHELMEITEQARGYYERVTDAKSIFGPPAVLKLVHEKAGAVIELSNLAPHAGREAVDLPVSQLPPIDADAGKAVAEVAGWTVGSEGAGPASVTIYCQNEGEQQRLGELLTQFAPEQAKNIQSVVAYLHQGFTWSFAPLTSSHFLPYHELLHRFTTRRRTRRLRAGRTMDTFVELQVGDFVVHAEHGIAKFSGLKMMRPRDAKKTFQDRLKDDDAPVGEDEEAEEFLTLEFDGGAKLHVPAVKVDQVQKYVGGFKGSPPLSTLGGQKWKNQKARVTESVKDLAAELLRVRAAREHMPGIRYPGDTPWQQEFEAEFPYDETEDQLAAMAEIKRDMQKERPMDRLLCGDVGYGKTELAIRAAFKAVEFGKQVAVLVPTTVLAEQHERTFRSRFADYPFRVESLSRFKSAEKVRQTIAELKEGKVDVVIGTHRLLSKDIRFADLGLVIIDEEQRFGVEHKERLLSLRMTVDVMTLSATPIPRTLHMSMLGLRDISSLSTAPADRRAVVTEVIPYNPAKIQQFIKRELAREGQVYFVHNRVFDIVSVADDIRRLVPEAKIVVGHGQMPDGELEDVMLKFMRREANVLVSTTIIESGIDIATANTMIITDADRFGLADLHQLRGRVGRYKHRAYCYLLQPEKRPIKERAIQRLKAIEQFSMLGAGFKIAMRDLEIRGAGDILGPEQSGHIAAVGYDMYCQLLDKSVKELKNERTSTPSETSVQLGLTGVIPKAYIPSDMRRLEAYRRLALAGSAEELARLERDITDAYGKPPEGVDMLLQLAELRIGARDVGIRSIALRTPDIVIRTTDQPAVMEKMKGANGSVRALPVRAPGEVPEVYYRPPENALHPRTLLAILRKRLGVKMPAQAQKPRPVKQP